MDRRAFIAASGATLVAGAARAAAVSADKTIYDAHVGDVPDGVSAGPAYPTIAAAMASAPMGDSLYRILIGKVTLREKVVIDRPRVAITGLSPELSQIVWGDYAGMSDGNSGTIGTRKTATFSVTAPHVKLTHLSIVNDFDFLGTLARTDADRPKEIQAVALKIAGAADQVTVDDVTLAGFQDTLFIDAGRTLVKNSRISGCVDFIFGAGTAGFNHCRITSRLVSARSDGQGYIAAPSTLKSTPYGFVFFDCTLDHEGEPFPDNSVALARPWRPTTSFPDGRYGNPDVQSACLYLRCVFGDHIATKGFDHMGYNAKGGVKALSEPQDARFYIAQCTGKAVADIPMNFAAPPTLIAGLSPAKLLDLTRWTL